MIKKHFKKLISVALTAVLAMGMSITTFAQEADTSSTKCLPSDVEEITEEMIQEYGIVSIDEEGNEVITILFAPSNEGTTTPAPNYNLDNDVKGFVHDGHTVPDNIMLPRHFCLTPHTHEVINLTSSSGKWLIPVTAYADQGFTISKEYSKSVEINASLNLNGGISKNDVEAAIGVSVGGSYTRGTSETYTATVPNGYKGRIVYYYTCTTYNFTNKTAYVWPNTIPQLITYEYDDCSAQGAPRDGYFGLQLIAR